MLVELTPSARCADAVAMSQAGAALVAPDLDLYVMPAAAAARLLPILRAHGALRFSGPDRHAGTASFADFSDPLVPTEWWRSAIGVAGLSPPPAGKPVTIVDSGVDVSHPEFVGRANTVSLNAQEPLGAGGRHGTSVASVIAAPENGVGIVGIYPDAVLRSWDAAVVNGIDLVTSEIVRGILAAAKDGPGVINLSLVAAEENLPITQAVFEAVAKGSLVVAASGNDGAGRNTPLFPAYTPHVLTVGATNTANMVAPFSSRSPFVDLAAPGVGIPIAVDGAWKTGDGTSYATPLVSGASAWVWTVRPDLDASQLFEVMRRSAVDIGIAGRDDTGGYGMLNVPAALAFEAPIPDPREPNDDIAYVQPGGLFDNALPPLTTSTRPRAAIKARVDRYEDPSDVYRVWLPRNGRFTATLTGNAKLDLTLWKQGTKSIDPRLLGLGRIGLSTRQGKSERLTFTNKRAGHFAYLAITFPAVVTAATYTLKLR
jgi:hypothetical protein